MDLDELSELLALPSLVADLDALESTMVDVLRRDGTLDELVEPGIRVVTGGGSSAVARYSLSVGMAARLARKRRSIFHSITATTATAHR